MLVGRRPAAPAFRRSRVGWGEPRQSDSGEAVVAEGRAAAIHERLSHCAYVHCIADVREPQRASQRAAHVLALLIFRFQ